MKAVPYVRILLMAGREEYFIRGRTTSDKSGIYIKGSGTLFFRIAISKKNNGKKKDIFRICKALGRI